MQHDVIIIGGSYAGLSAAMYIARARRSVCIVDSGSTRNRFSAHSHGFFAHDGAEPGAMLAKARAQVAAYPTTTFIEGEAINAAIKPAGFSVQLADGEMLESARLVLAFGIFDELPAIPGLAERWGSSVLHCPYCHGYEFSGQRLGVLYLSSMSLYQSKMIAEWGPTTLYLNGAPMLHDTALAELQSHGVEIEPATVSALHGEGSQLSAIELSDGHSLGLDALYLGPRTHLNSTVAQQLGCEIGEAPFGPIIRVDPQMMTSVPGVYAAGDIARGAHNVTWACADGVTAAMAVLRSLVFARSLSA